MNQGKVIHCAGIAVAVGAYFLGSYLASTLGPSGDSASLSTSSPFSLSADAPALRDGPTDVRNVEALLLDLPLSAEVTVEKALATSTSMPSQLNLSLTTEEIAQLAWSAIHEIDPVMRRRAMDDLIRAADTDNEMLIRFELFKNGAAPQQIRLVDYAYGTTAQAETPLVANKIPEPQRETFVENALPGWASVAPTSAIGHVEKLEPGKRQDELTEKLIPGLAANDINVATDYKYELEERGRPKAKKYMSTLSRRMAETGSLSSVKRWSRNLPRGDLQAAAVVPIAERIARTNGIGAVDYALGFVELDIRDPATGAAISVWATRDPSAASEYLATMPSSSTRDHAVGAFASAIVRSDPLAAIMWAGSISSPGIREQALARVQQADVRHDIQSSAEWVRRSADRTPSPAPAPSR